MKNKIFAVCLLVALIMWLSHKPMKANVLVPYKSVNTPNLGGTYVEIDHSLEEMNLATQEVSTETKMINDSLLVAPIKPQINHQIFDTAEVWCSDTN